MFCLGVSFVLPSELGLVVWFIVALEPESLELEILELTLTPFLMPLENSFLVLFTSPTKSPTAEVVRPLKSLFVNFLLNLIV